MNLQNVGPFGWSSASQSEGRPSGRDETEAPPVLRWLVALGRASLTHLGIGEKEEFFSDRPLINADHQSLPVWKGHLRLFFTPVNWGCRKWSWIFSLLAKTLFLNVTAWSVEARDKKSIEVASWILTFISVYPKSCLAGVSNGDLDAT